MKKDRTLMAMLEYTRRYREICLHLPEDINESQFDLFDDNHRNDDQLRRWLRSYFDLCSEEFDMYDFKLINKKVFEFWKSGILFALSKSAFRQAYRLFRKDTIWNKNFMLIADKLTNMEVR